MIVRQNKSFIFIVLGIGLLAGGIWMDARYQVPILMYHNISLNPDGRVDTVTPENFERQMAFLKKRGYRVLPLRQVVEGLRSGQRFPRNSVIITFDDAMANNFSQALPILKKHGFSATFFVPAGKLGQPGRMTWEEVRQLFESGMDIGSHGMQEEYLPGLPLEQQQQEIFLSKEVLEANLKTAIILYAYPIGGFQPVTKALIVRAGYRGAVTTNRGSANERNDVFELRRIKVTDDSSSGLALWAKVSGYYDLFRRPKNPY